MACCSQKTAEEIHLETKEYYGKELQSTKDLKTSACTLSDKPASYLAKAIGRVAEEVNEKFYGCGLVAPICVEGCKVMDLGSGSGRDVYVLAQLVGESGKVVGDVF